MRAAFVSAMERILKEDDRVVLLLGDIGVHAMKKAAETGRVFNCGVREQAMVNLAAGLAAKGFYPICHTIEPFLCERALEQIKLMAYNAFRGAFVTCGGSYDYSGLGSTHHCPAGPSNMLAIPGMHVAVPGTSLEAHYAISDAINEWRLSYIRLIDGAEGVQDQPIRMMDARYPNAPALITTGTLSRLGPERPECSWWIHLEVLNERYIREALRGVTASKFLVVEEFYSDTITAAVSEAMYPKPVTVKSLGIPRDFIREYGSKTDLERAIGLTQENVVKMLKELADA